MVKAAVTALALTVVCFAARAEDGAAVFTKNCALCHQSGGAGLPGQFPRLAGRVGAISAKPAGRAYLIDVVSYGMAGQITVDQQPIIGVMPALNLPDDETAEVLAYLQGLGNSPKQLISVAEVAAERAKPHKSSADVHAERKTLQSAKVID
jgi:mono/diheme cytochrome c family protein